MDYDELTEELTDFFARQHHDSDVARTRAVAVVEIVKRRVAVEAEEEESVSVDDIIWLGGKRFVVLAEGFREVTADFAAGFGTCPVCEGRSVDPLGCCRGKTERQHKFSEADQHRFGKVW